MMAFACPNIVQHPHFEGAGAVYVVALIPKKAVWAAGAVFCGFRDGQTDRPGVGRSAHNCVRSFPERQFDGVAVMHAQSGRPLLSVLTATLFERNVVGNSTKKVLSGVRQPSLTQRRSTCAAQQFAVRFSYGRACVLALWASRFPLGRFLAEHARPITRATAKGSDDRFDIDQRSREMAKHDNAGNLPATYSVPKTITDIEAAFAALSQAGDQDFDSHLIEWREAQLRNLCALDMRELSIKMECLLDITGECGGLTPKGQELVHGWVQSIQRDIHKMMEG